MDTYVLESSLVTIQYYSDSLSGLRIEFLSDPLIEISFLFSWPIYPPPPDLPSWLVDYTLADEQPLEYGVRNVSFPGPAGCDIIAFYGTEELVFAHCDDRKGGGGGLGDVKQNPPYDLFCLFTLRFFIAELFAFCFCDSSLLSCRPSQ